MAKKGVGIRLEEEVIDAVKQYSIQNRTNISRTIELILCRFFNIQLDTTEQLLLEKDAEIRKLQQELEAMKRRQKLATVSDLHTDKFTLENG